MHAYLEHNQGESLSKKLYILFWTLVGLYILVNFATDLNPQVLARYNMSATEYQLLRLTLLLPLVLVWFAAFYGFGHVLEYARKIKESKDGKGFKWIAAGLGVLAIGLPVGSVLSFVLSRSVVAGLIEQPASTIISTHFSVGYQMTSFLLLAIGTWKLTTVVKKAVISPRSLVISSLILTAISSFYIYVALNNPAREVPVNPGQTATYYMADWLIVSTIIIPYILTWAFGMFAFIALKTYNRVIGGVIYKTALKKLSIGMAVIISMSILLQFLTAAITTVFAWELGALVVLLQLLVIAIGIGFLYVAMGARSLTQLEEIK